MTLYLKVSNFCVQLFPRITKQKSLLEIAIAEELDEFVEIEGEKAGIVEYCTIHGYRILSSDRPFLNLFVVLKKGLGFAKAVPLAYVYSPNHKFHHPRLVVTCSSTDAATVAGYAKAVELPYQLYWGCDSYIQIPRSLVVYINSNKEEATDAGYANAVPIPELRNNVYIKDWKTLDTNHADSMVDVPRFG